MTVPYADTAPTDEFRLTGDISWWDRDAQCTLVISQPAVNPALWSAYLTGAERSYRKHRVQRALDVAAIRDGHSTALFWATIDGASRLTGGVRAKGPLRSPDESHAIVEWAGQPGLAAVRKMIADRIPFGVLEMKSAWVTDDPNCSRSTTQVLARSGFHAMALMGLQFCMATAAPHVLDRWRTSGGLVASIPATPYPDDRYRTKIMWWDRCTFARHAEPEQISKILVETARLRAADAMASGGATQHGVAW